MYINNDWFHNYQELLPSGYHVVKMALADSGQYVISVRVEELDDVLGLPVIRRNMTIYPDHHYKMHVAGTEVSIRKVFFVMIQTFFKYVNRV